MRLSQTLAIAFFALLWAWAGLDIVHALWTGRVHSIDRWVSFEANPIWASILFTVQMCSFIALSALAVLGWQGHMSFRRWAARKRPKLDTSLKDPGVAGQDVHRND